MFKYLLYQIEYRKWLFFALLVAIAIHLLPGTPELTRDAKATLAIVVMTVLLVILEPVPLPVVALLIVVLEVIFQIATPSRVAQSFMSDSVMFIGGSMMLAVAVAKQHLDKRILLFILRLTRTNMPWTVFSVVGISALLASVMGEHSVAAIMLPVAVMLVRLSQSKEPGLEDLKVLFMMSVAHGCAVAAIATPSAGARNAIMLDYWKGSAGLNVGYLDWMCFMYPLAVVQVPILYFALLHTYRPELGNLTRAYASLRREMVQQQKLRTEDWITIWIVIITLLLWMFSSKTLGLGPVALIGVLLCVLTGVLTWADINRDLNWGVIMLYASIISIGLWMDTTGAADWIAINMQLLLGFLHIHGGVPLIMVTALVGMVVGSLLSTGPGIAILGPIVLKQAQLSGSSPLILGMVVVASASYANLTPASSPACSIIYGSGMVRAQDYVRIGLKMSVFSFVTIVLFAAFYWPIVSRFLHFE